MTSLDQRVFHSINCTLFNYENDHVIRDRNREVLTCYEFQHLVKLFTVCRLTK